MKEVPQIEAIKYALRQSKDGTVVSFVIHPNDIDHALQCLPIGSRVMLGWYAVGDDENPKTPAAGKINAISAENTHETPLNRAKAENKPKRRFEELSLPQQCALRCDDGRFGRFLAERCGAGDADPVAYVRAYCNVNSRADLSTNHDAANRWRKLESEFQQWLTDETYKDVAR